LPDNAAALEATAIDPPGLGALLRLGLHALVSPLARSAQAGDWRMDPCVTPGQCREGLAFTRRHMHAILDGEPVRLPKYVTIRFNPVAFRALAPADAADDAPAAPDAPLG
jgi:diacylglycerol kinase family enzyme